MVTNAYLRSSVLLSIKHFTNIYTPFAYRDCLHDHIMRCRDADVKCPCNVNDEVACKGSITEAEMRSVCTSCIKSTRLLY